MGDLSDKLKRIRELRCQCVDEIVLSPNDRTKKVLSLLGGKGYEITNWDLICFSVYYLSSQLVIVPDLKQEVESLAVKLMYAHYFSGGDVGLYDEIAIQTLTRTKLENEINLQKNDVLNKSESFGQSREVSSDLSKSEG